MHFAWLYYSLQKKTKQKKSYLFLFPVNQINCESYIYLLICLGKDTIEFNSFPAMGEEGFW